MMILVPLIVFPIVAALYYTVAKKTNQTDIKNKLVDSLQQDNYELEKSPAAINVRNHLNTESTACQQLSSGPATNKPSNTLINIDKTETSTHSKQKKQARQMVGGTIDETFTDLISSTATLIDTEVELVRAGYIHPSTGKRKLSRKNKGSYITAKNGKIFDARKIISVMQKKFANGNSKEKYEDSMALKLQMLQAGINTLIARDELPENFAIPDDCIVHRIVKNVTYGELKQIADIKSLSAQLEGFHDTERIIVSTSQRPRIKALKINYKISKPTPLKH